MRAGPAASGPPGYKSPRLSCTFTSPPMMRDFSPQSQTLSQVTIKTRGGGPEHDEIRAPGRPQRDDKYFDGKDVPERQEGLQASSTSAGAGGSVFTRL